MRRRRIWVIAAASRVLAGLAAAGMASADKDERHS